MRSSNATLFKKQFRVRQGLENLQSNFKHRTKSHQNEQSGKYQCLRARHVTTNVIRRFHHLIIMAEPFGFDIHKASSKVLLISRNAIFEREQDLNLKVIRELYLLLVLNTLYRNHSRIHWSKERGDTFRDRVWQRLWGCRIWISWNCWGLFLLNSLARLQFQFMILILARHFFK